MSAADAPDTSSEQPVQVDGPGGHTAPDSAVQPGPFKYLGRVPSERLHVTANGTIVEGTRPSAGTGHPRDCSCTRCVGFTAGPTGTAITRTKSGAYSLVEIKGRAGEVATGLREIMELEGIYRPLFAPTVEACAIVLVRMERAAKAIEHVDELAANLEGANVLTGYVSRTPELDDQLGNLRDDLRRWSALARGYLETLGMTPRSLAALTRDTGIGKQTRAQAALVELRQHLEVHHG